MNRFNACLGARDVVRPTADILEREDGLYLYLNLPGVKEEDLDLESLGNELTLSAQSSFGLDCGERLHNLEFTDVRYHDKYSLPDDVDHGRIAAELRNGVLTVYIPRRAKGPKRIPITAI